MPFVNNILSDWSQMPAWVDSSPASSCCQEMFGGCVEVHGRIRSWWTPVARELCRQALESIEILASLDVLEMDLVDQLFTVCLSGETEHFF